MENGSPTVPRVLCPNDDWLVLSTADVEILP